MQKRYHNTSDRDNERLAQDAIGRGLTMGAFVREQDAAHDHKLTIDELEQLGKAYDRVRRGVSQ